MIFCCSITTRVLVFSFVSIEIWKRHFKKDFTKASHKYNETKMPLLIPKVRSNTCFWTGVYLFRTLLKLIYFYNALVSLSNEKAIFFVVVCNGTGIRHLVP